MLTQTSSAAANDGVRLDCLRKAIRDNRVSFPAQVPIFPCQHRVEIQWRLVALYFVQGWSAVRIARRYKVSSRRVHQQLRQWVSRARTLGYLQEIPTEKAFEVPALSAPHLEREVEVSAHAGVPLSAVAEIASAPAAQRD